MLTRRALFEHCAAAAIGSAAIGMTSTVTERAPQRLTKIRAFIVEAASPDSRMVGEAMAAQGIPSVAYEHELAEIYYETLLPAWRGDGPVAVAGLTGAAPLAYLQGLAWSDGLRPLAIGRHISGPEGWSHTFTAPQVMADAFRIGMRLADWREALARALVRTPLAVRSQPLGVRLAALTSDRSLFSWVFARPVGRASVRRSASS
jgi:hypothetical protein